MKLADEVRSTHGQDGAVVLHIRQGQMFRLNLVGSRMLELVKVGYSEEQISDQISREFSVAREIVATDVHEFLAHLERHRLLDISEREARHTP
jgi:Coenzyme PQQ synthesis protein D (PqqD)